ncbi:unnamed protein product [Parnassius apollo]|uniref:(apollo) hypothetical protein n=1 Tax=Parnassius apollo TaxID=110799 RepID=A0A8S3XZ40_PARAO|nr:unnamed protein product [Parnassius apollo]
MFSSLFGKRRSSPVRDEVPPIPGPKPDDGYVIVDPSSPGNSLYPNVNEVRQPSRPAPPAPVPKAYDQTFHYLQGVPFMLSRELQMAKNKDAFATEIGDLLAFLTSKINMSSYSYDFSVEKSVLKEC